MRIVFEVYTASPSERELVARYWALNEDGSFREHVADLLPYADIPNSQGLVKHIQQISSAWDTEQTCERCGSFKVLSCRTDFRPRPMSDILVCQACRENELQNERRENENAAMRLRERIDKITAENLSATISYAAIDDDIALILIALDKAISPRLLTGTFMRSDCRSLTPADSNSLILRLWKAGVILDLPTKAATDAYFLEDDSVWHYTNKVVYFLVPDRDNGKDEDAFSILSSRSFVDHQALRSLWLDYAVSDCMAYLYSQCALHNLEITIEDSAETGSILRTALLTYSVAQLWSVLWKVVRDAASLTARTYYNYAKAAATIPGKIRRNLEKVSKDKAAIKSWNRPDDQPAGTLGDVLYEYFGVDEDTPGREVMSLFPVSDTNDLERGLKRTPEELEGLVCSLMPRAIAHNRELEVMLHFARRIRSGDNIEEALDSIFAAFPQLIKPTERHLSAQHVFDRK